MAAQCQSLNLPITPMSAATHLVRTEEAALTDITTTCAYVQAALQGGIVRQRSTVRRLGHQFMAQSLRPITTQGAQSHSHVMLDILSRVPHLEHAREEGGLEFIQSVQIQMNAPITLAINGVRTLMEDTFATVIKAMNFRGKTHVLISTNVQFLTAAVLTLVTTLLVRSLVHVQVVSNWILGKEAAEISMSVQLQKVDANKDASTRTSRSTAFVDRDSFLQETKRTAKYCHVPA